MDKAQLLPCPFCGSHEVSAGVGAHADGSPWDIIECESCEAFAEPDAWSRRAPQPPSASGERDLLDALKNISWVTDAGTQGLQVVHLADVLALVQRQPQTSRWSKFSADIDRSDKHVDDVNIAPSPGIDAADQKPVAQVRSDIERSNLVWIGTIPPHGTNLYAAPPAAQPSAEQQPVAWLQQNIDRPAWFEIAAPNEKALTKDWTDAFPVFRHPASAQPDAAWLAEAERLIDSYAESFSKPTDSGKCRQRLAALLAHLRTKP